MEINGYSCSPTFGLSARYAESGEIARAKLNDEFPNVKKVLDRAIDGFERATTRQKGTFDITDIRMQNGGKNGAWSLIVEFMQPKRHGKELNSVNISYITNPKGKKFPNINITTLLRDEPKPVFAQKFQKGLINALKESFGITKVKPPKEAVIENPGPQWANKTRNQQSRLYYVPDEVEEVRKVG